MRARSAVAAAILSLALPAPASAVRDVVVTSFDGTKIVATFHEADRLEQGERAPTILVGPGWSQSRSKDSGTSGSGGTGTEGLFGSTSVRALRDAGYNVLTWDPRGFGQSGGTVTVDGPENEGRDVQALIDFVAEQPEAQLDGAGDPRLGMSGASYGGGIQLVAAAIDRRVDAIVPVIAWHSLVTSLYKNETFKGGWGSILFAAGVNGSTYPGLMPGNPAGPQSGGMDPHIYSAFGTLSTTGRLSDEDVEWFRSRGPGAELMERIRIPTLLIQGTVDTLFTLDEAIENYRILRRNSVPVKMLWFCGGHGACLTNAGDRAATTRATIAWLDRHVKRDASVGTGPRMEWLDQDGASWSADDYPLASGGELVGEGGGVLALEPGTRSGAAIAATAAPGAVEVTVAAPERSQPVVGRPRLTFTYQGSAADPDTRVYAQLVDSATRVVLGNQVTPVKVTLDGRERTAEVALETVAATLEPGRPAVLQLLPGSSVYDLQRTTGAIAFSKVRVELPIADPQRTVPVERARLRVLGVRGARAGSRRLTVIVSGAAQSTRATLRGARGRRVARSRPRSFEGRTRLAVRLRRPLRAGRYVVAVSGRAADGTRLTVSRRLRVRR
jgi:ABC-2 type transport system ATP-binding protein